MCSYRESADELLSALRQPGVLEQPFGLPIGTVSGAGALQLRLVETLVHGWDLARATDQLVEFPVEIVEPAFAFTAVSSATFRRDIRRLHRASPLPTTHQRSTTSPPASVAQYHRTPGGPVSESAPLPEDDPPPQ